MEDIEVWKQMYRTVFIAADKALTLMENMRFQEAMETLQRALLQAEDLYIAADGIVDERTEHTMETFQNTLRQTKQLFTAAQQRIDALSYRSKNKDEKS